MKYLTDEEIDALIRRYLARLVLPDREPPRIIWPKRTLYTALRYALPTYICFRLYEITDFLMELFDR